MLPSMGNGDSDLRRPLGSAMVEGYGDSRIDNVVLEKRLLGLKFFVLE